MPARTNEFQRLVAWIQRALAPEGAVVTESALVESPILAGQREIDVVVEGQYGAFLIKIAVEAKDESRKLDITKFDAIVQKYTPPTGVLVNKVVIVTRKGFTRPVVKKASLLGVELLTLHDAQYANWKSIVRGKSALVMAPHVCAVGVEPVISDVENKEITQFAHVHCTHGRDHGTVGKVAANFAFGRVFKAQPNLLLELPEMAKGFPNGAAATFTWPLDHHFIRFKEREYKATGLKIVVHAVNSVGTGTARRYRLESASAGSDPPYDVHHFQMRVAGRQLDIVMPNGVNSKKITLKLSKDEAGRNVCDKDEKY